MKVEVIGDMMGKLVDVAKETLGRQIPSLTTTERPLPMKDCVHVVLPSGLELTMYRRGKPLLSKGAEESVEDLWARFANALKRTDWPAVLKVYGDVNALEPVSQVRVKE